MENCGYAVEYSHNIVWLKGAWIVHCVILRLDVCLCHRHNIHSLHAFLSGLMMIHNVARDNTVNYVRKYYG